MLVIPSGREVRAREVQPLNASFPMLVIPSGREVRAREVQPLNAQSVILDMVSGRLMSFSLAQYSKIASFHDFISVNQRNSGNVSSDFPLSSERKKPVTAMQSLLVPMLFPFAHSAITSSCHWIGRSRLA